MRSDMRVGTSTSEAGLGTSHSIDSSEQMNDSDSDSEDDELVETDTCDVEEDLKSPNGSPTPPRRGNASIGSMRRQMRASQSGSSGGVAPSESFLSLRTADSTHSLGATNLDVSASTLPATHFSSATQIRHPEQVTSVSVLLSDLASVRDALTNHAMSPTPLPSDASPTDSSHNTHSLAHSSPPRDTDDAPRTVSSAHARSRSAEVNISLTLNLSLDGGAPSLNTVNERATAATIIDLLLADRAQLEPTAQIQSRSRPEEVRHRLRGSNASPLLPRTSTSRLSEPLSINDASAPTGSTYRPLTIAEQGTGVPENGLRDRRRPRSQVLAQEAQKYVNRLKHGDVVWWHNLKTAGDIPGMSDDLKEQETCWACWTERQPKKAAKRIKEGGKCTGVGRGCDGADDVEKLWRKLRALR